MIYGFFSGYLNIRLSDVAINSLIGFFSLVLKDINTTRFKEFPSTAYMAKKLLDITKRSKTFVACTDCNKLYNPTEIMPKSDDNSANSEFKCTHIEFQIIQWKSTVNSVDQNYS